MARAFTCAVVLMIVVHTSSHTIPAQGSSKRISPPADLPIKYPGPVKPVDVNRYEDHEETDIPQQCRGLNYCTVKPKHYPEQEIRQLFDNKKVRLPPPDLELELLIGNRQGDPNEEDNCPSRVTYEPIYQLKNSNTWQTVVQAPELSYEQKVRIETCLDSGRSCFTVATFPMNIRTKCVQKYATWKLQVLDDNKKPVIKEVDLPSCCSCHYEVINKK